MANGQPDELIAPIGKVRIVADHERASASAHHGGEGRIDVVLVAGFHDMELQSTRSCCRLQVCGNRLGIGTGWFTTGPTAAAFGTSSCRRSSFFGSSLEENR